MPRPGSWHKRFLYSLKHLGQGCPPKSECTLLISCGWRERESITTMSLLKKICSNTRWSKLKTSLLEVEIKLICVPHHGSPSCWELEGVFPWFFPSFVSLVCGFPPPSMSGIYLWMTRMASLQKPINTTHCINRIKEKVTFPPPHLIQNKRKKKHLWHQLWKFYINFWFWRICLLQLSLSTYP